MFCVFVFQPMGEMRVSVCVAEYVWLKLYVFQMDRLVRIQNNFVSEFRDIGCPFRFCLSRCTRNNQLEVTRFVFVSSAWRTVSLSATALRKQSDSCRRSSSVTAVTSHTTDSGISWCTHPILHWPWCLLWQRSVRSIRGRKRTVTVR